MFTDGKDEILDKFSKFDARVVFSAEDTCWPDRSLAVSVLTITFKFLQPQLLTIFNLLYFTTCTLFKIIIDL